jgi:RNA polymerase sigma factor (sigma-70 family)
MLEHTSDAAFPDAYPFALRAVKAHSAAAVRAGLPWFERRDLEQEAIISVWLALRRYDTNRAGLHTFIELVVRSRFMSKLRSHRRRMPLESLNQRYPDVESRFRAVELRTDVGRVLAGVSFFDRTVALSLARHSATDTSRRLGVSRTSVYRSIKRLRSAFSIGGYAQAGQS